MLGWVVRDGKGLSHHDSHALRLRLQDPLHMTLQLYDHY